MSVQVTVGKDTYVHLSNGGWSNFVDALQSALSDNEIDGVPLFDRDVYCDISADLCARLAKDLASVRDVFVIGEPKMADTLDDLILAFRAGARGGGVCVS